MALFKVSGNNLKRVPENKMKEPFTNLIIQLSANYIPRPRFEIENGRKKHKKFGESC